MNEATLQQLYDTLGAVADALDHKSVVPDRFESTAKGLLAEMDSNTIRDARTVIHRLMLWHKYPSVSPESYLAAHSVKA